MTAQSGDVNQIEFDLKEQENMLKHLLRSCDEMREFLSENQDDDVALALKENDDAIARKRAQIQALREELKRSQELGNAHRKSHEPKVIAEFNHGPVRSTQNSSSAASISLVSSSSSSSSSSAERKSAVTLGAHADRESISPSAVGLGLTSSSSAAKHSPQSNSTLSSSVTSSSTVGAANSAINPSSASTHSVQTTSHANSSVSGSSTSASASASSSTANPNSSKPSEEEDDGLFL